MTLPVRITGLNRRWSAGLFQKRGFVKGDHGGGEDRYRALGIDIEGNAYVPLYANWADQTHILAGHPVVAGPEALEVFIQVTRISDDPPRFPRFPKQPVGNDRHDCTSGRHAHARLEVPGETGHTSPRGVSAGRVAGHEISGYVDWKVRMWVTMLSRRERIINEQIPPNSLHEQC